MEKFRVFPSVSGWDKNKKINILMKNEADEYKAIRFGVRAGDVHEADFTKIQNEMDAEVLQFMKDERALGYQLVPLIDNQVCIHVLRSWRIKIGIATT